MDDLENDFVNYFSNTEGPEDMKYNRDVVGLYNIVMENAMRRDKHLAKLKRLYTKYNAEKLIKHLKANPLRRQKLYWAKNFNKLLLNTFGVDGLEKFKTIMQNLKFLEYFSLDEYSGSSGWFNYEYIALSRWMYHVLDNPHVLEIPKYDFEDMCAPWNRW